MITEISLDKYTLEVKNRIWDLIITLESLQKKKDKRYRYHISQALRDIANDYEYDRVNYWNK